MASRKAAQHAAHVAHKIGKRRGLQHVLGGYGRVGRGWGLPVSEDLIAKLPHVIAGVEVTVRKERWVRTRPWRRIRRKRRPRPELIGAIYRRDRLTKLYSGLPSQHKERRERARHRRRQKVHG